MSEFLDQFTSQDEITLRDVLDFSEFTDSFISSTDERFPKIPTETRKKIELLLKRKESLRAIIRDKKELPDFQSLDPSAREFIINEFIKFHGGDPEKIDELVRWTEEESEERRLVVASYMYQS
ncbi:MAG TPA: hypothetical protein ENF20_09170, partial [Candidatus Marinimicrobia bacterium]|nr:hypothetical protein [Candidatus Neomarinimicrobiota bacterium]